MQYLQADTSKNTLRVLPAQRDFGDFGSEQHFDYHVATLQLFEGSHVRVVIEADRVPYSALLHMPLFVRIVRHISSLGKALEIRSVVLENASTPALAILRLLTPILPAGSAEKIQHRARKAVAVKKAL